jgi:hypothetical protein
MKFFKHQQDRTAQDSRQFRLFIGTQMPANRETEDKQSHICDQTKNGPKGPGETVASVPAACHPARSPSAGTARHSETAESAAGSTLVTETYDPSRAGMAAQRRQGRCPLARQHDDGPGKTGRAEPLLTVPS